MARRGKYYGSLAGGFAQGLLDALKLGMMMRHYEAMDEWYRNRTSGRYPPGNVYAGGAGGTPDWSNGQGGGGSYQGGAEAEARGAEMSQYLQEKYGLSPAGAAGVVGNAWQENKFGADFRPGDLDK